MAFTGHTKNVDHRSRAVLEAILFSKRNLMGAYRKLYIRTATTAWTKFMTLNSKIQRK